MQHIYLELAVAVLGLFACILGFRKHDRRAGVVFLCSSIGILGIALEPVLPDTVPWLGDAGAGVMLLGSAFLAFSVWHARRGGPASDA